MKEIKDVIKKNEEIYHVLGLKNQYYEKDYTTQSNLQIQRKPFQIINGFFKELEKNVYNFYGNTKDLE